MLTGNLIGGSNDITSIDAILANTCRTLSTIKTILQSLDSKQFNNGWRYSIG